MCVWGGGGQHISHLSSFANPPLPPPPAAPNPPFHPNRIPTQKNKPQQVTLIKQHKGRYTNAVEYTGILIPETRSISGSYSNGTISLGRKLDLDELAESLSGWWEGESISRSSDPTTWTDTEV